MSRFGSTPSAKSHMDVYTAITGIAALVMVLGAVYMVLHNMEYGSSNDREQAPTPFEILDS